MQQKQGNDTLKQAVITMEQGLNTIGDTNVKLKG